MEREILHLALPSFPLQALIADRNKFQDRPAALAGVDSSSSRVLSLNPRASSEGVRRGMILAEARRRCLGLEVFTPRPDLFAKVHRSLLGLLGDFSPVIEPKKSSFYIELTGAGRLLGAASDVASKILREMDSRLKLISSAGIATSKLVGFAASSLARTPGLAQVMPWEEPVFLRPFPLKKILANDRYLLDRLFELGIERVADLQNLPMRELVSAFGRDGYRLHQLALGIDLSPVVPAESFPELEEGESLAQATNDVEFIRLVLWRLCERLGRRLRERKLSACLVRLLLVFRDGAEAERRVALKKPSALDRELHGQALRLLESALCRRVQVVYLGLRATRLARGFQPDLFGEQDEKTRLYRAIDDIRLRYGNSAIRFGKDLCPA